MRLSSPPPPPNPAKLILFSFDRNPLKRRCALSCHSPFDARQRDAFDEKPLGRQKGDRHWDDGDRRRRHDQVPLNVKIAAKDRKAEGGHVRNVV